VDLSATAPGIELPRPFIAACVVSLALHAGIAGWYSQDTTAVPVQLPHPTLHVKIHALRERASIAPAAKRKPDVVRQAPVHRTPPPVTTPEPAPVRTASRQPDIPVKPREKTLPATDSEETAPPVQASVAAIDSLPTYSPPSCNSAALNNPKPVYPRVALRRGIEGLVLLHVDVDEQGRPVGIRVKKSAGFKPLDIAALRAVRRWRFLPALRNGTAVSAGVEVPVRFRLDETDRSAS